MHRRALLAGLVLAASGWAGGPRAEPEAQPEAQPGVEILEPIYAVIATPQGLTIRVASMGCATKADFTFYLDRKPDGAASVAFGRRRVELCKPFKTGGGHADLVFSYAELGVDAGAPLSMLNPIVAAPTVRASTRRPTGAGSARRRKMGVQKSSSG